MADPRVVLVISVLAAPAPVHYPEQPERGSHLALTMPNAEACREAKAAINQEAALLASHGAAWARGGKAECEEPIYQHQVRRWQNGKLLG